MSRYNTYMNSHFSGCQALLKCRDPHRNRNVTLYRMPGYEDALGVSDGVDCWIAPITVSFGFDMVNLLKRLRAGEQIKLPVVLHAEDAQGSTRPGRKRIVSAEPEQPPHTTRKRLLVPVSSLVPSTRRKLIGDN